MKIPRLNTWLLFGLPIVAIFCGVCAVTDKGITDLDNPAITQRVCSDYPPGQAPPDCVSSQDVLMNDGDDEFIERPFWAVLAVLVALAWAAILIADWRAKRNATKMPAHQYETPPKPPPSSMLLLFAQDTGIVGDNWIRDHPVALLFVVLALVAIVLIVIVGRRNAKKRREAETPPETLGKPASRKYPGPPSGGPYP